MPNPKINNINVGGVDYDIGGTTGVFYDSVADAEDDLENIEEGSLVYTNDPEPSIQDEIDRLTTVHFINSQVGAGSKNVTIYTASTKRLLVVTKKSGVVVGTKEIPTNALESGDKIVLGNETPVTWQQTKSQTPNTPTDMVGKPVYVTRASNNDYLITDSSETSPGYKQLTNGQNGALASSAELSDGATLTFNGNNSFTLAVTDSTLSVYLYADMVVLGGSASAMNVAIDLTDTDMVSTNVEDAIKELHADLSDLKVYSTTETAIGVWHDGRTIYRRCVVFDINHSWAHRVWGTILFNCGFTTLIDLKPIGGNSRTVFSNFFTRIENGDLQMYLESDSDWSIREFVIEYAK